MKKSFVIKVGLWIVFFVCVVMVFRSKNEIVEYYPSVSARYAEGVLTSDIIASSVENLEHMDVPNEIELSFWGQKSDAKILYGDSTAIADVMFYKGNAAAFFPTNFVKGTYPASADSFGCAISNQLAWTLFRSADVLGLGILYNDTEYTIRGVFDSGKDLLAIFPIDEEQAKMQSLEYTGVDLYGSFQGNRQDESKTLLSTVGLPATEWLFDGKIWVDLVSGLSFVPVTLCVVWMFFRIFTGDKSVNRDKNKSGKKWIIFILICILAVILSRVLVELPAWLVPSQWSDFSYWEVLKETFGKMWVVWLSANPSYQDVAVKNALLRHLGLVLLTMMAFVALLIDSILSEKSNISSSKVFETKE